MDKYLLRIRVKLVELLRTTPKIVSSGYSGKSNTVAYKYPFSFLTMHCVWFCVIRAWQHYKHRKLMTRVNDATDENFRCTIWKKCTRSKCIRWIYNLHNRCFAPVPFKDWPGFWYTDTDILSLIKFIYCVSTFEIRYKCHCKISEF